MGRIISFVLSTWIVLVFSWVAHAQDPAPETQKTQVQVTETPVEPKLPVVEPQLTEDTPSHASPEPEVEIAPEDRLLFADLFRDVDPAESSRVIKMGKVGARSLLDMGIFYLASGMRQYWECAHSGDSIPCKQWLKQVTTPGAQHLSFMLFVASQKLTSSLTLKAAANKSFAAPLSNMLGLSAGAALSGSISEIVTNPHFAEYREARKIKDPDERSKKSAEAFKKLKSDTFGNKSWYLGQTGGIPTLLAASFATELSSRGAGNLRRKLGSRLASPRAACIANRFLASSIGSKLATGSSSVAHLLAFFGWESALSLPADWLRDQLTVHRRLAQSRKSLLKGANESPEELSRRLDANSRLWDEYRERKLLAGYRAEASHKMDLVELDRELQKPAAFYAWFADGMREDSGYLEDLRSTYYSSDTPTSKIEQDAVAFLQGFFCGPDPKQAFQDSRSLHGIPVPGSQNAQVTPYLVATPKEDPGLCQIKRPGLARLKRELTSRDFKDDARTANSIFEEATYPAREARIRSYESQIAGKMVSALEGKKGETLRSGKLPEGVLLSFKAELTDLGKLKSAVGGKEPLETRVAQEMDEVERKRDAAQQLLDYLKTPENERVAPPLSIQDMIAAATPEGELADDQKVIRYFKGFIIQ